MISYVRRQSFACTLASLAAILLVAGASPAVADNPLGTGLDDASNLTPVFDVIGLPELGPALKFASIFAQRAGGDPNEDAIANIQLELTAFQQEIDGIKLRIDTLQSDVNESKVTAAADWYSNGTKASITQQTSNLIAVLSDLRRLQDDAAPDARRRLRTVAAGFGFGPQGSTYDLLNTDQHNAARADAFEAVAYTAAVRNLGLRTDQADACHAYALISDRRDYGKVPPLYGNQTDCAQGPNPLWSLESYVQQIKSNYADYLSLFPTWSINSPKVLINVYRFQPALGLAPYFAQLRAAIAAMSLDLGGVDMATADHSSREYSRYVSSKYSTMFNDNIAFLTYTPCPDFGDFGCRYPIYHDRAATSLSQAFAFALQTGQQTDPKVWEQIDRMRDMLAYAQIHGNIANWTYAPPAYITTAEAAANPPPRPGPSPVGPRPGGGLSCVVLGNCALRAIPLSQMVGVSDAGDAVMIDINGGQLSLEPQPIGHIDGPKFVMADAVNTVFVGTRSQWFYGLTRGQSPAMLQSDLIYDMYATNMFGGGDGVVYMIETDGNLYWMKAQKGPLTPAPFTPAAQVGNGWGAMRFVTAAGQGVIYAVAANGDLLWYHHDGYFDGSVKWRGPGKISKGWDKYINIVAEPNGVILGISADGSADVYQYLDYDSGTTDMSDPALPGSPASRMKGPYRITGVDLSAYRYLVGVPNLTPNGVIK